ncbi:extracellular solute-binding protein [Brachybacterium squillarum]|uniref:ABC transporter substrate-binding protein n=1 Tax=Brachybacterium squillarum TaxID=661979 RepID=UPI0022221C32|nr:extracellular solute-binding protein [Brachybacterium squillarum]MCW1804525.1 extracellular solute-binding protein [Brachybacterium squillarum]
MSIGRRTFVSALAASFAVTGLAACGGGGDDWGGSAGSGGDAPVDLADKRVGAMDDYGVGTTFKASEPLEIDILYRDHPAYPLNKDWTLLTTTKERNNVTFAMTTAPLSDYEQRRSLLIGAGDAPSVIPVTYPGQESQYVASGALLAVSDYLDLLPNFTQKVKDWGLEDEVEALRQEDGKYYLLPGLLQSARPDYTVAVRKDVLDELGLDEPTTWDEFRTMLQGIKDAKGGSYVFSDRWKGDALLQLAAPTFGTSAGWGLSASQWDEASGAFVFPGATDEYKQLVEYFAGLVKDGLMDPESFTQEDDPAFQKLGQEKSFVISTNFQEIATARAALDTTVGEGNYELVKIRQPSGPAGDVFGGRRLQSGLVLSSKAAEKDTFVAIMQWIDWNYYSDEGLEFGKWGVEGTTFTRDGDTRVLADDVDWLGLNPDGTKDLRKDFGFMNGVFLFEHGSSDDLVRSLVPEEEIAWEEGMADKKLTTPPPPAPMNVDEQEQAGLYQTALTDYVKQNTLAFITGQRDLAEWDDYVKELEGQNMTTYIDLVNGAYKRFAAKG